MKMKLKKRLKWGLQIGESRGRTGERQRSFSFSSPKLKTTDMKREECEEVERKKGGF